MKNEIQVVTETVKKEPIVIDQTYLENNSNHFINDDHEIPMDTNQSVQNETVSIGSRPRHSFDSSTQPVFTNGNIHFENAAKATIEGIFP